MCGGWQKNRRKWARGEEERRGRGEEEERGRGRGERRGEEEERGEERKRRGRRAVAAVAFSEMLIDAVNTMKK